MYSSKEIQIVTLLIMIQKVNVYVHNSFSYSNSLEDMLISDGERLNSKQEKSMLLDITCLVLILYSTIPRWTCKLLSLHVREVKCLGMESKPAHGLTEWGNTEQTEKNEILPFPMLVQQCLRFQGITLCLLRSEPSWSP